MGAGTTQALFEYLNSMSNSTSFTFFRFVDYPSFIYAQRYIFRYFLFSSSASRSMYDVVHFLL